MSHEQCVYESSLLLVQGRGGFACFVLLFFFL